MITADHGNAEHMLDGSEPDTAHTCNPVPLIVTVAGTTLGSAGTLADVAPTVLSLLDIPQPAGMDGHTLLPLAVCVGGRCNRAAGHGSHGNTEPTAP